ncbi:hypothetical protein D3C85_1127440 [compost metagenome]
MIDIAIDRQIDRRAVFDHLQMLEQQAVIHGIGMVVIRFYAFFHRQMGLIFIVAVFGNDADVLITNLFTQFAIKRTGNKTFT